MSLKQEVQEATNPEFNENDYIRDPESPFNDVNSDADEQQVNPETSQEFITENQEQTPILNPDDDEPNIDDDEANIDPSIIDQEPEEDEDDVINSIKTKRYSNDEERGLTQKKIIRKSRPVLPQDEPVRYEEAPDGSNYNDMNPQQRKRMELEEKMTAAVKTKSFRRRKADEDDLERMQDDKIDHLKELMINAANLDVDKNTQGQIATEKLKLLDDVTNLLSRADLAISILDNNLLEAVRLWLEPLPDASMPAYQIQKELIHSLESLPIKTDHLVASGIGKVLVFYQRSKRTEPQLKKIVDRLIGDWTRPILNKSDSYKDRAVQFGEYNRVRYSNKLSTHHKKSEAKTLYEQNAERRKRAAIPTARTAAYKIAPRVDTSLLRRQAGRGAGYDDRFRRINQKITSMGGKRKATKKGGPSIEGRDLSI
ncbi:IWS1 [Candida pseudojiufengensis]|uniref:IWS1 n=1 Tax=Candida pseudojiufengensis TaxID=497109 RepID=UPI0022253C93|nr:IWS1 [Candida pseudojiufengensis]KAI5960208.1 IWS1 [Candida pseudojiufengensis]